MHGRIVSSWRIDDGLFKLDVTIPTNTTATVWVRAGSGDDVIEADVPAAEALADRVLHIEDGCAVLNVESGQFQFTST